MTIIINKIIDRGAVRSGTNSIDPLQDLIGNKFILAAASIEDTTESQVGLSVSNPHETWVWNVEWTDEEEHNEGLFPGKKPSFFCLAFYSSDLK